MSVASDSLVQEGAATVVVAERRPVALPRAFRGGRGLVGLTLVVIVVLAGVIGPMIVSAGPNTPGPASLAGPSGAHLLGTDELGRDVLSRLLSGIRIDLIVVFIAAPLGAVIGAIVGLSATTWNASDTIAQRVFDLILSFPALILAIMMTAMLGTGVVTVSIVIAVAEIPVFGRLVRSSALTVRELPYVESSKVIGAGRWWLLRRHVLPNSIEPLTVQLAISMSMAVFIEGAMSFLGIGINPPTPSLGSMIQDGMQYVYQRPLLPVGPLVVVCMLTLGFQLIAQALAEVGRG